MFVDITSVKVVSSFSSYVLIAKMEIQPNIIPEDVDSPSSQFVQEVMQQIELAEQPGVEVERITLHRSEISNEDIALLVSTVNRSLSGQHPDVIFYLDAEKIQSRSRSYDEERSHKPYVTLYSSSFRRGSGAYSGLAYSDEILFERTQKNMRTLTQKDSPYEQVVLVMYKGVLRTEMFIKALLDAIDSIGISDQNLRVFVEFKGGKVHVGVQGVFLIRGIPCYKDGLSQNQESYRQYESPIAPNHPNHPSNRSDNVSSSSRNPLNPHPLRREALDDEIQKQHEKMTDFLSRHRRLDQ